MNPNWTRRHFLETTGLGALALASGACAASSAAPATQPLVATTAGRVRGARVGNVEVFRGVPYGAPTGGTARFMPPQPAAAWSGVREAFTLGDRCPQGPEAMAEGAMSEDCLVLNVWTPSSDRGARRPVMVWLHPGGFHGGAGYQYTGQGTLASKGDVVQVELNHRLNVFGYLYLGGLSERYADSGNLGMLDLVAGLEWVRDNIEAFGGDPNNVTIFGESGGGAKVTTLMAMPAAKGLFHKAIAQSGGNGLRARDAARATADAEQFLAELELSSKQVDSLENLSWQQLLAGFQLTRAKPALRRAFRPVVDGRALPHQPWDPAAPVESREVPLIIGSTRDEATILLGMLGSKELFALEEADMRKRLGEYLQTDAPTTDAIVAAYREMQPDFSPSDVYFLAASDYMMRVPAVLQAERKAAQGGAPAYLYLFTWESPAFGGAMKAHHGAELSFVFDTVDESADRIGSGADRRVLADQMLGAWSRFAHTGDPNHPGLPTWSTYDAETRPTMLFDMPSRVESDPLAAGRSAITPLLAGRD